MACLGHVWTNYIHTRLFLVQTDLVVARTACPLLSGLPTDTRLRTVEVELSPFLPNTLTNFIVEPGGLRGIRVVA